jgi:hypothetical protein
MALVTLDQARRHLRIPATGAPPTSADDAEIADLQASAEALVLSYVQQRIGPDGEAWAAEVVTWDVTAVPPVAPPPQVAAAVLGLLGYLWRFRGDDLENERPALELGELPHYVTALLYQLRDPAVA